MHPITRNRDRIMPAVAHKAVPTRIDVAPLLGVWVNFDTESRGIVRAEVTQKDNTVMVSPFGSCSTGLAKWESSAATVFSEDVSMHRAVGFQCSFDLRFQKVLLVAYVNRHLLTLEAATTFTDGSHRARYLTRQHFYRLPL